MILRHLLGADKRDGFYVDVGAYDPVQSSNTYFFYLNGWRGLNIEARPGSRAVFDRVRPRDINVEVGIGARPGHMTYYVVGDDSTMNSFSPEFLRHIGMRAAVQREVSVPVLPLVDVLERHLPPGQPIDFMSVDVEGHDLTVLQSNDWNRYRPRVVVVEDVAADAERSDIVRFMRSRAYAACAQNVVILDTLSEFFFVDRSA